MGTTLTQVMRNRARLRQNPAVLNFLHKTVPPLKYNGVTSVQTVPFTWWMGSTHMSRSAEPKPCHAAIASASMRRFAAVRMTPLGGPVVPEV